MSPCAGTVALDPQQQQWGALMAAALAGVVPVLVVFVAAQRYLIAAFVSSGVKG